MGFLDKITTRSAGRPSAKQDTDTLWTTPWAWREEDCTYYGFNDQVWLYRTLPINPIEWEDPLTRISLGQQLGTLLDEIGATSSAPVGGLRQLANNREIHVVSVTWDSPSEPPSSSSANLLEFQKKCLGYASPNKVLMLGVRLRPSASSQDNTRLVDQAKKVAVKVLLEDVPDRGAYVKDKEFIGSLCSRFGARVPTDGERRQLESWFNNGKGPDTTIIERTTSLEVPAFDTFEISAVMRFGEMTLKSPYSQWVLEAASHPYGPKVVSVRAELEPPSVTRNRARRSQRKVEASIREEMATGDLERAEYSETFQKAKEIEDYLVSVGEPILTKCSILMARAVRSADETYIDFLRQNYGIDMKPLEHRQIRALDEMLPTSSRRINPFIQDVSISMISHAGMSGFSNLGDSGGGYVGMSLPDYTPVFLDWGGAARENQPPAMLVAGDPGSGKTFLCQILGLQAAMAGQTVMFINPKGFDSLEPFAKAAGGRVVKMSALEEVPGAFDPFRYAPGPIAAEIATNHIISVLGGEGGFSQSQQLELGSALKRAAAVGAKCVADAFPFLEDQSIMLQIKQQVEGSSLFALGIGMEPAGDLGGTGGLTLIEFDRKLDLPDPAKDPANYTRPEKIALAAVRLVTRSSLEILMKSKGGVLIVDEAWTFLGYPEGLASLQQLGREGRSLNILPVFATQRIADVVSRDMEGYLSRVFCLKLAEEREAKAALTLCGLEPTTSRIEWLRDCGPRRASDEFDERPAMAIHRDLKNRHSAVYIAPFPEEVKEMISTNPEDRAKRAEKKY